MNTLAKVPTVLVRIDGREVMVEAKSVEVLNHRLGHVVAVHLVPIVSAGLVEVTCLGSSMHEYVTCQCGASVHG